MKKNKLIIFLLGLFFICLSVVEAKENPFVLDWKNDDKATTFELLGAIDNNLVYNGGYVNFRLDLDYSAEEISTIMRSYDRDGNILKEKRLEDVAVINAATDGEYIYAMVFDLSVIFNEIGFTDYSLNTMIESYSSDGPNPEQKIGLSVVKYDGKFAMENHYDFKYKEIMQSFDNEEELAITLIMQLLGRLLGYNTMIADNDGVHFLEYGMGIMNLDKDLTELSFYKPDYDPKSAKIQKYFNQVYQTAKLGEKMDNGIISLDSNNANIAYSSLSCIPDITTIFSINETPLALDDDTCDLKGYIGLTDASGNKVWEKELTEDLLAINVKLINNYVVAIGLSENGTRILVYDLDGSLVQTITTNVVGYTNLVPNRNGFIVSKNITSKTVCNISEEQAVYSGISEESQERLYNILNMLADNVECETYTTTEVYQLPYQITTKVVEGEGTATAPEEAFPGDEVEVEIKPDLGWVVDSVIVTDEEGNEIEIKDGKFTMPASDVTIEVKFKKFVEEIIENPNTAAISITGLVLLSLGLGYIITKYSKKARFLK